MIFAQTALALVPTVGKLPALGWNSWNAYHCNINETDILDAANFFQSSGLKSAGYQYVNIDDCWSNKARDSTTGRIVPNPSLFPSGISGVASKIHNMGLKIGIYSDAGSATCAGYPASIDREALDAQTFASWGIDYLKYDNCNIPSNWTDASTYSDWSQSNSAKRFKQMSAAIAALPSGTPPIQLSLCIWGTAHVWEWGSQVGQSWRITGDITPDWKSITSILAFNVQHLDNVGFYAHSDMDMMEIGNGISAMEERSHFALWAALKSPILLGTDLSKLNPTQLAIITNKELLAFSQDPNVGAPAKPFTSSTSTSSTSPPEFYAGQSSKGTHVFVLNTGSSTANKTIALSDVPNLAKSGRYIVHDMWTGKKVTSVNTGGKFTAALQSHDTGAWLIIPA